MEYNTNLSVFVGFGYSMWPSLRPGEEIWTKRVSSSRVKAGDIVTFRLLSGEPVTHRVVRVLRVNGQTAFLTKGDHRSQFDPLVLPERLVGRVTRAGRRNLRGGVCVLWGRILARLSYAYAVLSHRLSFGRRARLLKWLKGWAASGVSRIRLCSWVSREKWAALSGITIEPWNENQVESMAQIWNEAFPARPTFPSHFRQRALTGEAYGRWSCFTVRRGSRLSGWVLVSAARVECLAVSPDLGDSRSRVEALLLRRAILWAKRQGARQISCGPLPAVQQGSQIVVNETIACLARHGFVPAMSISEMVLSSSRFQKKSRQTPPDGRFWFRAWRASDRSVFEGKDFADGYNPRAIDFLSSQPGASERIRVVEEEGRPVGLCQWVPDDRLSDFRQIGWVWSIEQAPRRGYALHLVVDRSLRGSGVGRLLWNHLLEQMFENNCSEIVCWANRPKYYERFFGFVPRGEFLMMSRTF